MVEEAQSEDFIYHTQVAVHFKKEAGYCKSVETKLGEPAAVEIAEEGGEEV